MDRAINKSTGEIISAFEVHKNGSYQNLTKGEWIAPNDSIYNLDEDLSEEDLYVHYVKEKRYKNWKDTSVVTSPYFAIFPNSKANTIPENKEHKVLKNWLFNRLKKDDLEFVYSTAGKKNQYNNIIKLSELNIDWNKYDIEVHTKGYKALRADILLQFKKKHPSLGSGIFIEIQLSSQREDVTFNRSIDRAVQGYSTAWLFEKDFEFNEELTEIILKKNEIKIHSFSSELKHNGKLFIKNLKIIVEEQCRYLDEKIKETNFAEEELNEKKENILKELLERLNSREAILFNKIKSLEGNPFESLVENYKKELENKYIELDYTLGEYENKLKELQKEFNPRVIPCEKCNQGHMIFKVTPHKGKELYECQNLNCKHVIWVK